MTPMVSADLALAVSWAEGLPPAFFTIINPAPRIIKKKIMPAKAIMFGRRYEMSEAGVAATMPAFRWFVKRLLIGTGFILFRVFEDQIWPQLFGQ